MKFTLVSALTVLGLALAPVPGNALHPDVDTTAVTYDQALECAAFSVLAMTIWDQGHSDLLENYKNKDQAIITAARWLGVAMHRDGTKDGSKAAADLERVFKTMSDGYVAQDEQSQSIARMFAFDACGKMSRTIAWEFDTIEL